MRIPSVRTAVESANVPPDQEPQDLATDLLYPFYLDTDMSMAFAAALAGGVALESEQVARVEDASKAVKSLRGSLRLFGAAGFEGGGERSASAGRTDESTLVRRHTAHSIFIDLHEELRSSGRLAVQPRVEALEVGALVSMRLNPAVAPLRRVIEQVLRLLDVMAPFLGPLAASEEPEPLSRQDRRQRAREAAKGRAAASDEEESGDALNALRSLFVALRDDLEHSGMIDVVVSSEDTPGVVLTLDKRFADQTALELLHTSSFTVVGKVTQIWPTEDDVVFLYRRSVLSLLPALSQQVAVGVFSFLIAMAKALGVVDVEQEVKNVLGQSDGPSVAEAGEDVARADDESVEDSVNGDAVETMNSRPRTTTSESGMTLSRSTRRSLALRCRYCPLPCAFKALKIHRRKSGDQIQPARRSLQAAGR